MIPSLFVIDDFLSNPNEMREQALGLNYSVQGRFPGRNSTEKINLPWLNECVANIVRTPVFTPWAPDFSHGNCRLALASDNTPGRIHIDPSQLSGILYLSKPEDCQGGTEFFRHKRTGTDRLPMDQVSLKAAGYSSYEELQNDILDKDALDRSKWDLTMTVPMRFNRLILLQPHYWHTSGPGFGDSVDNGRLIYVMFFKVGRPQT